MKKSKNKILLWLSLFITLVIICILGIVITSEWKLSKLVPGGLGERFPTKIFSAPFVIPNGIFVSKEELFERLHRLDYRQSRAQSLPRGTYRWEPPLLTISFRGFNSPTANQSPIVVKLISGPNGSWTINERTQTTESQILLEPELIAEISGPQKIRRDPTSWDDLPPLLVDAVIAVEDRRFYKHHGIDPRAILRAAWFNIRNGKNLQGGSTITQQLVKNFFFSQEKTIQRKLMEAGFAVYLDLRYSKERIITLYLNHIYMGQDGVVSIAGMKSAAEYYFGKPIRDLNLSESAFLAGLIRSPFRYNPFQNAIAAKNRRDTVLKLMLSFNSISELEYERALASPLTVRKRVQTNTENRNGNDYFVAEVLRQLIPHFSEDILFRYGLRIFTTVDSLYQDLAQNSVKAEKNQTALVVMDPSTGRVLAVVGGKNFQESQFNRATQAHRQPGSAFKPLVYGAALEKGYTPASLLQDEPRAYKDGNKIWAPQNFDLVYRGPVSFREALAHSINGATLDLAQKIGPSTIIRFSKKMGIESPLENSLTLALGTSEVTPLELTAAYSPFANGGFRVTPLFINAVVDYEDKVLEINNVEREPVLDPALSYLMTSLLETTITEGTANSLRGLGWSQPSAGKTGTTNEGKDAWFIGYTPSLLVGVWVGNDQGKAVHLSGAKNALPIWCNFMKQANSGRKIELFTKPTGLTSKIIDPLSGALARTGCPDQKEELFIKGTEPQNFCPNHAGGFRGWLKKLFRSKTKKNIPVLSPDEPE